MNEHRDRILDLALREELSGEAPPDLSDRIRWRLAQNQHRQEQIELVPDSPRKSGGVWAGSLMGAAAALALIFLVQTMREVAPQPALRFTVAAGSLRWQSAGISTEFRRSVLFRPNTYTIFPVLGDRLEAATEESTVLKLAGLGTLIMSPGCVLEVEEMTFSEFAKGFVVGAVVVAVVDGTAQIISGSYAESATAGESLEMHQGGDLVELAEPVSTAGLQQQIAQLLAENERLLESAARRRAEIPESEEVAAEVPEVLEI